MLFHVYALFDKKIGKYLPASLNNLEANDAIESICDAVHKGVIPNADDMEFYSLGTYDNVTGLFDTSKPNFLVYLGDFVKHEEN